MTPKIVTSLAVAAVLSTAIATYSYRANNVFIPQAGVGEKLLPGLGEQINKVAAISIRQGKKSLKLAHTKTGWVIAKNGYQADAGKIKKTLLALAGLSKLEAKTSAKDKYLLIEVDAPGKKDGRGRLVELADNKGKPLASIIAGKIGVGKAGPGRDAQYVRLPGEKTSWLALGSAEVSSDASHWINKRFLTLDVDTIIYGKVTLANGEMVEVKRGEKGADGSYAYELLDIPQGREPRTNTAIKFGATDFAILDLVDVRKKKADSKTVSTAEIHNQYGLKIRFNYVEEDGHGWVSLDVLEKGSDTEFADQISKRTKGWEYRLEDYKKAAFKRTKESLLRKLK